MRLQISKTKNAASFYVVQSVYDRQTQKRSNVIVEKLGTYDALQQQYPDQDPYEWAKKYVDDLNEKQKEGKQPAVQISYCPDQVVSLHKKRAYHGGYLFLQRIYEELQLPKLCQSISKRHKFQYDLSCILSRLLYGRILFPSSKLNTYELSKKYIEGPSFELHQIYRALEVLSKETSFLQAALYKNSLSLGKRNTGVLYYDCTNFFFEIEEEDDLRKYGVSKEHRPNPIVQMGLFMDGDGIPLAFHMTPGSDNEQTTLKPLEKQILSDFNLSKFVVCTDAGISSQENRTFNSVQERSYITTQSIKKLKKHLREWALAPTGWHTEKSNRIIDLRKIDEERDQATLYYKERWIKENNFEQKLIITYSVKYKNYQQSIREKQIGRALAMLEKNPGKFDQKKNNDYKRFIQKNSVTKAGEVATKSSYHLNQEIIENEALYDGYYAVCTNLDEESATIAQINKRRWEIEECFRMMKSEFKARPVYLSKDERIKAHFLTCFMALLLYRLLEKKLNHPYTCTQLLTTLREMNFYHLPKQGYIPTYTRTEITDALHEAFGFRTDYEIITPKTLKNILKNISSEKHCALF